MCSNILLVETQCPDIFISIGVNDHYSIIGDDVISLNISFPQQCVSKHTFS